MNSNRKNIDIFKIYQENKLNPKLGPIEEPPFHKLIKQRPKTLHIKPQQMNNDNVKKDFNKSTKILHNKENIESQNKLFFTFFEINKRILVF
jgi:hypothetical protein